MGSYSISLISVIFFTFLWTPALSNDKCEISCQGSSSAPTFLTGHLYNYGVEGTVSIYLNGADKQETNVKISGQVSVSAHGNCALSLKVNSLGIVGPDGKKYSAPKGIEKLVRFSLQDGRIGPEICSEADDTRASLNIKRAIISLLQTEQKSSTQIDVFGACPTEISSSQEGSSMLVHRSRDLSRCAHREQTKNELITAIYSPNAEIKDTQLLRSTLNVESKVKNGVPEKVSAVEQYLYRPFSVGENGARAEVNTKLTLTGSSAGGAAGICPLSRTIIFENPHQEEEIHSNYQNIFNAVKETCKVLNTEASSKSAGSFAQLVRILRSGTKADLLKVFGQIKGNSLEKRVFLDGLLRAGTGYSIEASIQILKSKELSPLEEKIVFLSLGNAKHVTSDAIKAAAGLLDLPNLPKNVYLGVGALAGIYCRDHNCHNEKNEGIIALSKKLGAKLQNCKPKTKVEEDAVVAVLKGIRNIRHLEDSLIDRLVRCASDNSVKARVRVNALEAFQGDACAAKIKKTAIDIMKNRQLDSEIRIKAYLAVIKCPCGKTANEIKNLLDSEPVHQVGRFISTSLRAIRASANPDKQLARQHYGLIGIPTRFNVDDRKYSFYREMSYNVDALGVGGNVESSVIYSQDSFLPRSVNMNVTAEVFGHNVNVFEVGGRQGNLDRVLEHFLGPKSFLRTQKPQEVYDTIRQKFDESYNKVEKSVRGRRSIKSEVDNFDKQVKAESIQYNNELDLDIYIKLFGTDAVFLSLGDGKGYDFTSFLDESLKTINEGMDKMKHFQQELRGHVLFLDAELAYPTSTGLPLKLDAVGSATGRFEVSSSVDIRQILRNPEASKIDFKLVPSTDIEVSLVMMVDAESVSAGLKVVTNLHSSTGGHVIFKVIENGKGFDLQLGLPIEKQEILTASNELVFFSAERGQMEKLTPIKSEKNEYSGCFDQLSGMLGVTFCGKLTLPFSITGQKSDNAISAYLTRFPLVGSSKVNVVLEKNDIRGYHIKGVFHRDSSPNRRYGMELLFDAEGKQNRRTQFIGEIIDNDQEKTIKASLDSPIKKLNGQFSLYTKSSEYALMMKAQMDEAIYYGRAGVNIAGNERRSVYKPIVEYQLPGDNGKKTITVDGQITRDNNGDNVKYTLDGVKFNIPNSNEPVNVEGHFNSGQRMIESDLKIKKGQQNMLFSGSVKGNDCKLEFMNTLNPYINFKLSGHIENTNDNLHNDIDLYYGGDCSNPRDRITINQLYKRHYVSIEDYNIITKNKIEIHALPLKAQLNLESDPKKFDLDAGGVYFDRSANLNVDARTHLKKAGDYRVKMVVNVDKQSVEALVKRDIVSPDKSNVENYIDFKNIGKYELSGVVLHKLKEHDTNIGAVGHLKISGSQKNEEIKFDVGVIETANQYSSHATISSSKGELLNYLLKLNCGNNPNGQLKFNLKDAIAANGQYQVADSDGKGNGNIMIHFKKVERIIKADVKFVAKEPLFNAEVDLYLNFEKDNNDKVHLSTSNKKTDRLLESKNKIQYAGKSSEINIHKDGLFTGLGKDDVNIEVVLPDERCLNFKVDREVNLNDNVYNGHAQLLFSDATKRGGPASIISYKGKLAKANIDKEEIDYEGQVELKLKDGKNLLNTFSFKNIPKGDKSDMAFKSEVSGSMLPKRAVFDASATYTQQDHVKENYRVKASYGDDLAAELVGDFEANVPDKGEKKYVNDYTMTLRLPFEQAHDIKLVSTFMFLQPENKAAEVTIIESVQVNADLYKLESNGKYQETSGNNKVKLIVPHVEPIILDVNYKIDENKDKTSGLVNLKAQYGKGKTTSLSLQGASSANDIELKIVTNSPQNEKLKKFELSLFSKNPSPDTYNALIVVDADGRVYKVEGLTVYSASQPVFDLKYSSPSSPKTRFYFKGVQIHSKEGRGEIKIENIKDFNLDSTVEYDFEKDFAIKYQGNSEKLGMKNYKMEITSKDAGSGKRLEFQAVNDGKNVLSGSTSFISKQEGPKTIIEGSGTLKIKDEQKPASFKYIRTILTEGSEQGMETFINLAFGERNHVAESRLTNMEYKASYVYCEEKKQCAHAELNSKFITSKPGSLQHQFNMGYDLRKLGLNTEFGLQINNEFSEKNLPQYDMNLHVNRESDKFHFHVYSQPEHGKFPAGIVLTFPKRVVAIEALVQYPTDKAIPFPIKAELNMYPDKNRPQSKTSLRFNMDASMVRDERGEVSALIGFSHPRIGREALVKFHGSIKRPSENSIVIDTSSAISHNSLGNDREVKFHFEGSPTTIKLLIDTPVVKIIQIEGSATIKEDIQNGELKFSLLEGKPVEVHVLVNDYKYYEFSTGYSGDSGNKLSITGHLDPEKRVDASIDIVLPGKKTHNIAHGALFLENNLIKSDYGMSKDNYNNFVKALKKDMVDLQKRVNEVGEKSNNDFKQTMKKIEPTYKKLKEAYEADLNSFRNDLEEIMKSMQESYESIRHIIQAFLKIFDEFVDLVKPVADQIAETVTSITKKVIEMYEKQLEPQLKELYENFSAVVKEYTDGIIEVAAHFAAIAIDFFEKHKDEIRELANVFTEIFKDLTRIIVAQLKEWRGKSNQFFSELIEQIKNMPIIGLIKEKYQEMAVPEQFLGLMKEAHQAVRAVMPTEEIRLFLDALDNYAQKKLRQEKFDESAELRTLYERLAAAAASLIRLVRQHVGQLGISYPMISEAGLPGVTPVSIPPFRGSAALSFITQLIDGDIPSPLKLIQAYRPRSFNPLDEIPSKMRAVIVNGQHIFTFDGRHLTFPGTCRYVLAHDHVDRNFTLIMQLANGSPKSLILEDKSGVTIELKENGQAALNGAAHGYPIIEEDVFAFREPNGRIGLGSRYGIMAFCTSKLEVCYIDVNGFYLGKLRGLLGDGNNEPFDDFRLPNGKIANSESDFGNAYRLASSCAIVKTPEHNHAQMHQTMPPACETVFGGSSPLRPLALVLDVMPFRQACIHACTDAEDALAQACDLARGYAALAQSTLLPAILPPQCVKCTDADKPRELGEVFDVKLPAKQADIIVSVEVTTANEKNYKDIVVPLVSQIIDQLKSKRITDVKVYLFGVTSKYPYPILYDTDLRLKSAKVKFDDQSRYNLIEPINFKNPYIDGYESAFVDIVNRLRIAFGIQNVIATYHSIFDLPLRPAAVKHYISSVGTKCEPQLFLLNVARSAFMDEAFQKMGLTHSLITDVDGLKIGGGKSAEQVVGFSKTSVLMLGDKKQKDTETLRASLELPNEDNCVDFTEETSGVTFSASNFRKLNPQQQKQFISTAASSVTSRLLQDSLTLRCSCAATSPFSVRTLCAVTDRKEVAHKKK